MKRRRGERIALGGAVVLLHLALLWAWRSTPTTTHDAEPEPAPLIVRLLSPLPSPPQSAPSPPPSRVRQSAPLPTASRRAEAPTPITEPTLTLASPPERSASAPNERALDTRLPAAIARPAERSMKDRLLNDPRSNSPRPTVGSRVAAVAGTDEIVEETMDATRMRVKQRGRCIEVHVSRDAQINPWNQNHSPTPKLVKPEC